MKLSPRNSPAALQVCTTLGMLTPEQAKQLREAGLTAYNHNLDTSPEYYSKITSSRKYEVTCHAWPHEGCAYDDSSQPEAAICDPWSPDEEKRLS